MKIRKSISILLVFAMYFSMCTWAGATSSILKDSSKEYDEYTINFPSMYQEEIVQNNNALDLDIISLNEKNVVAAKEFVNSLGLKTRGYEYIEKACIEHLDSFLGYGDGMLKSYTVKVPRTIDGNGTNNITDSMDYFGTYASQDFYSQDYSTYILEFQKQKLAGEENMQNFVDGLISIGMTFVEVSNKVNIAISLFQTAMGIQPGYTVKANSYTENYFILDATCRGIYTHNSNLKYGSDRNKIVMVYSDEYGTALPYSIFHSLDSSLEMPTCPKNGEKISVETDHFNDKTTTLSYAWNRYMDKNNSSVWVDSLKYTSPKIVWENE